MESESESERWQQRLAHAADVAGAGGALAAVAAAANVVAAVAVAADIADTFAASAVVAVGTPVAAVP